MNTLEINGTIEKIKELEEKQVLNESAYNSQIKVLINNNEPEKIKKLKEDYELLNETIDGKIDELNKKFDSYDLSNFTKIYLKENEFSSDMEDLAGQKVRYYSLDKKFGETISEFYIDENNKKIFEDIIYSGAEQFSLEINSSTKLYTDLGDFLKEYNNKDSFGEIMLIEFSDDFQPR